LPSIQFDLPPDHASEREKLRASIDERCSTFRSNDGHIGLVDIVKHSIDTGDHSPVRPRARQYHRANKEAIGEEEIREYKSTNVVRPSGSP
jgi:hypothetical protein